jgi:hypothetical protein
VPQGDWLARLADQTVIDLAIGVVAALQDVDITTASALLRQAAAVAGITEAQAARTLCAAGTRQG